MPNANYVKGRRKEYKICDDYRKLGYDIVQRSAGSHSPIDVIAIDKKTKVITLIQAKPDNYPKNKEDKLMLEQRELKGMYRIEFIVI